MSRLPGMWGQVARLLRALGSEHVPPPAYRNARVPLIDGAI